MAIYFGGQAVGDNIQAAFTGNTSTGFQSFTISAWIYIPVVSTSNYQQIAWIYAPFRQVAGIFIGTTGAAFDFGNESASVAGPAFNIKQWMHVLCSTRATSQTAAIVTAYVNGRLRTNASVASGSYGGQSAYTMCMGSTSDLGNTCFNGYIEDARYWTRPFTAADAIKDMASSSPDKKALIGWNPCRDGYIRDFSGTAAQQGHATWTSAGTAPTAQLSALTSVRNAGRKRTF